MAEPAASDLAVIGGGPAGLATVLAARALAPSWDIQWCRGTTATFLPAYEGNDLVHRLNVPVERMGLDAQAPSDFFDWLRVCHPERLTQPGQFVPRQWFGEYMAVRAQNCGAEEHLGEIAGVMRCGNAWQLNFRQLQDGSGVTEARSQPLRALRLALCVGMPNGLPMPGAPSHWIGDPWEWWRHLPEGELPLRPTDTVLVVGSGLTAVDMVLGLRSRGFPGLIRVVSTGGRWSHAHADASALSAEQREALDAALDEAGSARDLLRALRRAAEQHPWRAVIDALRAQTNLRWALLPPDEQRRVLRHAFGVWNRHRHRMAPDVLASLAADAALHIEPGRIRVGADGVVLARHRGVDTRIDATLILDCRGPGFRAALAGDSLLARLVREGVLQAHPLGTGVAAPVDSSLALVGAARFGERFETSAVPELRQQASDCVRGMLSVSQSRGTK